MNILINPISIRGTVSAPPSKSYTIRALVAALLANGKSRILKASDCEDVKATIGAISNFGAEVNILENSLEVISNGLQLKQNIINCGESGLLARISTCIAAHFDEQIIINAGSSLLNRPPLVSESVLNLLGVKLMDYSGKFPICIQGPMKAGNISIDGSQSSQFISGLFLTLPLLDSDSAIVINNPVSKPYIQMTIDIMKQFGVAVDGNMLHGFSIKGRQNYTPCNYSVEGDWSGAAFLLVAGALCGEITITGLNLNSLQADRKIIEVLAQAGAYIEEKNNSVFIKQRKLQAFSFDAGDCPDLIPPLAVLASGCNGTSQIIGVERLIYKESNRAKSLVEVLTKLGVNILEKNNSFYISAGQLPEKKVTINPAGDHRIAMAAAIRAFCLKTPVEISDSACVNKSFPNFFEQFNLLKG